MDDNVCFNCDGSGYYGARTCRVCAGSGHSVKTKAALFGFVLCATVLLWAIGAWAMHRAIFG